MLKSKTHFYKFILMTSLLCYESFGGYYRSTPPSFSFTTVRGSSSCSAVTITFSNIVITVTNKNYVDLSFTRTINGLANTYSEIGFINGSSSLTTTFPPFKLSCVGAEINITPKLNGGFLNSATTTSTFSITATGNQTGTSVNINASFTFFPDQTAQITTINGESGGFICANSEMSVSIVGDSYSSVSVFYNNVLVETLQTDNFFRFNQTTRIFKTWDIFSPIDGISYQIRIVYNNGNSPALTKNVTVYNPIPIANTNVLTASKPFSCYGEAINLNVNIKASDGIQYAWADGFGSNISTRSITDFSKPYFVILTKASGICRTESNQVSVQLIPNFTATATPDKTQACEGQIIQINASPNNGNLYNYLWSTGGNGTSIGVPQNGSYIVTISPKTGGCPGKSSNTINNLVFEKAIIGDNISLTNNKTRAIFCKDEASITLSAIASDLAGLSYQWSGPKNGKERTLQVESSGEYTLQLFRGACQTIPKKITVIGKITPNFTLIPSDAQICKGQKMSLITNISNNVNDYNYQWFGGTDGKTDLKVSTTNYDATDGGIYRVVLNPIGGNCNAITGIYEVSQQVKVDAPITNFQIAGRKANDLVPICNLTNGINLLAISENDVSISWNGGIKILKENTIIGIKEERTFTAKFERGKCVESISVSTKIQPLLVNLKSTIDANRKYITCSDNTDFKLIAEPNYAAATVKWKDLNDPNFSNINMEFAPTKAGKYYAVANLPECGTADSKPSREVDVTLIPDFKINIATQLENPICEGTTQIFTAIPTYGAYTGGYNWVPNLSLTQTLQSKIEGNYSINIKQDGCKAFATATLQTKASKPSIVSVNNSLTSRLQTVGFEWLIKELPSSNDPTLYKSFSPPETKDRLEAPKMGSYILKGNRNGCGIAFSDPVDIFVLANESVNSNVWSIFPNPSTNSLTIENNSMDFLQNNTIELRNSSGMVLKSWFQSEKLKEYNIGDLSSGAYHLIFNQKNSKIVKKIIKL